MTIVATPRSRSSNPAKLLEVMLTTDDASERLAAFGRALDLGYGSATVVDEACTHNGKPLLLPLRLFYRHLRINDPVLTVRLTGQRAHTEHNCRFDSAEDVDGYGPALGTGEHGGAR